jgi:hypothetical protein
MGFQQQQPQPPQVVQTNAAAAAFSGGCVIPKLKDVLFGCGKPTCNHPGNNFTIMPKNTRRQNL